MSAKKLKRNEIRERVAGCPFFESEGPIGDIIASLRKVQNFLADNGWRDGEVIDDSWSEDACFNVYATRDKTREELDKEKAKRDKARITRGKNVKKQIEKLEKELKRLKNAKS